MLKGLSLPFSHTIVLLLGVMGLLVGYQAITNINAQTLEPRQSTIDEAIASLGGSETYVIGGDYAADANELTIDTVPEDKKPRKQMRGLIAFNMLSAANCEAVTGMQYLLEQKEDRVWHFDGFDHALAQTKFSGTCFGANSIDLNPIDNAAQDLNPISPESSENANDMEGRYGRINFRINETFDLGDTKRCGVNRVGNENCRDILMSADYATFFTGTNVGDKHPDFFSGYRNVAFLPGGGREMHAITRDGGQEAWNNPEDHELFHDEYDNMEDASENSEDQSGQYQGEAAGDDDPDDNNNEKYEKQKYEHTIHSFSTSWMDGQAKVGNGAKLYYWRVRMKNVPAIAKAFPQYLEGAGEAKPADEGKYEDFIEDVKWRFCEGAEGHIQSNARRIKNGGEASGSDSNRENGVYGAVYIDGNKFGDNKTECIPQGKEDRGNEHFLGFSVDVQSSSKNTCSINDAMEGRRVYTDETNVRVECGFRYTDVNFGKFDGSQTVYRPGWFSNTSKCSTGQLERSFLEESLSNSNNLVSVNDSDGDKQVLMEHDNDATGGDSVEASWRVAKMDWDEIVMRFDMWGEEISRSGQANYKPGELKINLHGNGEAPDAKVNFETNQLEYGLYATTSGTNWQDREDGASDLDGDFTKDITLSIDGRREGEVTLSYEGEDRSVSQDLNVKNEGEGIDQVDFKLNNINSGDTQVRIKEAKFITECN